MKNAQEHTGAPELLSLRATHDLLGIGYSTLSRMRQRGEIATVNIGRRVLVPADEVKRVVEARRSGS